MRVKQSEQEITKELIDTITALKDFYDLGEVILVTSHGGIFPNKDLPTETALALLYANLGHLYRLILRRKSRDLTWMQEHMDKCISFIKQGEITEYLNQDLENKEE